MSHNKYCTEYGCLPLPPLSEPGFTGLTDLSGWIFYDYCETLNTKTTGDRDANTAKTTLDVQQKFKSTGGFGVQQRDDQTVLGDCDDYTLCGTPMVFCLLF